MMAMKLIRIWLQHQEDSRMDGVRRMLDGSGSKFDQNGFHDGGGERNTARTGPESPKVF